MGVTEAQKFVHTLRSTFTALEVLCYFCLRASWNKPCTHALMNRIVWCK